MWCGHGEVLDHSVVGSIFGHPELACCSCGRRAAPRAAREATDIVLLATHTVDATDARIWAHFSKDMAANLPTASLWLLYFHDMQWEAGWLSLGRYASSLARTAAEQRKWQATHRMEVCIWSPLDVARLFPALLATVRAGGGGLSQEPAVHEQRYYWFHSSLAVWDAVYSHAYTSVRYIWRIEPDVLLASMAGAPLSPLIGLAGSSTADVLLPRLTSQAQDRWYPHFYRMDEGLAGIALERRMWGLVSVGRYSSSYLRTLRDDYWAHGIVGYEEVTLPTWCLKEDACQLAEFNQLSDGLQNHVVWRFGFNWDCSLFVDNARRGTNELWHPVKQRGCYLEYLDASEAGRADELAPWAPTHCAGWCRWSDANCVLEAKKGHCVDCEHCLQIAANATRAREEEASAGVDVR